MFVSYMYMTWPLPPAVLLDLLLKLQISRKKVVVIATARSRQHLHPDLLQSRGDHIFDHVLEIAPPTLVRRRGVSHPTVCVSL